MVPNGGSPKDPPNPEVTKKKMEGQRGRKKLVSKKNIGLAATIFGDRQWDEKKGETG